MSPRTRWGRREVLRNGTGLIGTSLKAAAARALEAVISYLITGVVSSSRSCCSGRLHAAHTEHYSSSQPLCTCHVTRLNPCTRAHCFIRIPLGRRDGVLRYTATRDKQSGSDPPAGKTTPARIPLTPADMVPHLAFATQHDAPPTQSTGSVKLPVRPGLTRLKRLREVTR
ncbi:hypothetical protein E2C01_009461 [Portunus trituberculatus]|uniref:Uncharacterized protein n=1 Tax=Portunus trituberculatus TaxID=210409 RepID=A0A5B7D5U2_PORTR|nr:hypothetical protein [Portunus trituberculatus]